MAEARDVLITILGALGGFILAWLLLRPLPSRDFEVIYEDDGEYVETMPPDIPLYCVVRVLKTIPIIAKSKSIQVRQMLRAELRTTAPDPWSCLFFGIYSVEKKVGDDPDADYVTCIDIDGDTETYTEKAKAEHVVGSFGVTEGTTYYIQLLMAGFRSTYGTGPLYAKGIRAHLSVWPVITG